MIILLVYLLISFFVFIFYYREGISKSKNLKKIIIGSLICSIVWAPTAVTDSWDVVLDAYEIYIKGDENE